MDINVSDHKEFPTKGLIFVNVIDLKKKIHLTIRHRVWMSKSLRPRR